MNRAGAENWVDNPLPYIFQATVVAISPLYEIELEKEAELVRAELGEANSSNYKQLQVGDVVTLNHFMFAENRFYLDKQARDFIKNPQEYRIEHWEGYVKIHPTMIESIIKDKTQLTQTSPFMQYKQYVKDNELKQLTDGETTQD